MARLHEVGMFNTELMLSPPKSDGVMISPGLANAVTDDPIKIKSDELLGETYDWDPSRPGRIANQTPSRWAYSRKEHDSHFVIS